MEMSTSVQETKMTEDTMESIHSLVESALNYKLKGNPTTYNAILSKLANTSDDEERRQLFMVLPRCISILAKDLDAYHELIHRIYTFDFLASEGVIDAYIQLITHFVTVHTTFLQPTIHMLVRNFLRIPRPAATSPMPIQIKSTLNRRVSVGIALTGPTPEELDAQFEVTLQKRFESVHVAFEKVLQLVPASIHHVFHCLCDHFPHKRLETPFQLSYLGNLFQLTKYAKGLQERVLSLIVEKLVAIDVEIKLDSTEEDVFTMDDFLDDATCPDLENPRALDEMADKLDHLMVATFTYLEAELESNPKLFSLILKSFDQSILNTHRSKYPQFLLFYVAKSSTESQELLLSQLISVSLDPKVPPVTRLSCSSYLASYVARAKYLSINAIKHTLFHVLRYIHGQVDILDEQGASDKCLVDIIQTACYIVCFRGLELCSTESGYNFVRSLGWQRVLTCSLSPMRHAVFHASVSTEFMNVAELLGLVSEECLEILWEGMKQTTAKNLERSTGTPTCFFPFDPYLLRRSFRFIGPSYLYWKHADPNWSGNSEAFGMALANMKAYDAQEDESVASVVEEDDNVSMGSSYASLNGSYIRSSVSEMSHMGSYTGSEDLNHAVEYEITEATTTRQSKSTFFYHDEEEIGF